MLFSDGSALGNPGPGGYGTMIVVFCGLNASHIEQQVTTKKTKMILINFISIFLIVFYHFSAFSKPSNTSE